MAVSKRVIRSDCLSTDRVIGEFDEEYVVCPICTNIFWKAVACKNCENSFCLNCIRLWLDEKPCQCPFNCHFEERKAPGILLKLLSKLKFSCENKSRGCEMIISYEALEKHQFKECEYRLKQCRDCLEEMNFRDFSNHEKNCLSKELNCFKCSSIYYQNQGHTQKECLAKQISILQKKINQSPHNSPPIVNENFKKLNQLYTKLLLDEDYSTTQLDTEGKDLTPSAPPEQTFPSPSAPPKETLPSPSPPPPHFSSLLEEEEESSRGETNIRRDSFPSEELRISKVNFNRVNVQKKEGDHIPNGYAGFYWENAYSMSEEYVKGRYQLKGFLNSFEKEIKCVAFNSNGNPLRIYLPNPSAKCSFHSFQALSIYHQNFPLTISGFRSNIPLFIKKVILDNQSSEVFQVDFKDIDQIIFTPTGVNYYTLKPQTFALISIHFIF